MEYTLYTDGGSRGNPGHAAIGISLCKNEQEIGAWHDYIGVATNNQAEYQALKKGLEEALFSKITHLECYLDSELVVKQLNGEYKVKEAHLQKIFAEIQKLRASFQKVIFSHIPRAKNSRADQLVNMALDEHINA